LRQRFRKQRSNDPKSLRFNCCKFVIVLDIHFASRGELEHFEVVFVTPKL
jgi:hypothetical protein